VEGGGEEEKAEKEEASRTRKANILNEPQVGSVETVEEVRSTHHHDLHQKGKK